jgi:hypothetical protein
MAEAGSNAGFSEAWQKKFSVIPLSLYSWCGVLSRLLKNAHLLRYPAASPSWWRGEESLLIPRDATPHPSLRQAQGRLIAACVGRERFETVPYKGFRAPCICAFFSSLRER